MLMYFALFATLNTPCKGLLYKFWDQMPPRMLIEPIVESAD